MRYLGGVLELDLGEEVARRDDGPGGEAVRDRARLLLLRVF